MLALMVMGGTQPVGAPGQPFDSFPLFTVSPAAAPAQEPETCHLSRTSSAETENSKHKFSGIQHETYLF